MSARGFGPVIWAGAVASAALGFYLVSLRVASERASLEDVETEIALAQRDIRVLQTELGTRGRLAQLERWNVKFIRLSAPTADQFVDGGFQLATLVKPEAKPVVEAPIIMASAPVEDVNERKLTGDAVVDVAEAPKPSKPVSDMVYVAGYTPPSRIKADAPAPVAAKPAAPKPLRSKAAATVAKDAKAPTVTKAAAKPATKPAKTATADPLSPLPAAKGSAKGQTPGAAATAKKANHSKGSVTD